MMSNYKYAQQQAGTFAEPAAPPPVEPAKGKGHRARTEVDRLRTEVAVLRERLNVAGMDAYAASLALEDALQAARDAGARDMRERVADEFCAAMAAIRALPLSTVK